MSDERVIRPDYIGLHVTEDGELSIFGIGKNGGKYRMLVPVDRDIAMELGNGLRQVLNYERDEQQRMEDYVARSVMSR